MKKTFLILINLIALCMLTGCMSNIFIPGDEPYIISTVEGDYEDWKSDAEKSAIYGCADEAYYEGYEYFVVLNTEFKTQSETDTFSIPFFGTGINISSGDVQTSYICRKKIIMFNNYDYLPGELQMKNPKVYNTLQIHDRM